MRSISAVIAKSWGNSMVSRWRLRVRSAQSDKLDWMQSHGFSVETVAGEEHLNHPCLDAVETAWSAMDVGERLLRELSGYYRLQFHQKLDVQLVGVLELLEGNKAAAYLMPIWVDGSEYGTPSIGQFGQGHSDVRPLGYGVAFRSDALSRAMQLHGDLSDRPNQDWQIMHKINEAAHEHLGKLADQWIDPASRNRMRHTANDFHSVGDGARHVKVKQKPFDNPMSYADARSTIDSLLRGWIKWESHPNPVVSQDA